MDRYTSRKVVNHWGEQVPKNTTLVCDSFFGSHRTADNLANRKVAYLFLVPKDQGDLRGGCTVTGGYVLCWAPQTSKVLAVRFQSPQSG